MSMRASGASELITFSYCHILKLLFPFSLYSVGTSDTLSQKHIYFQVSNNTCRQFPFITYGKKLWRYIKTLIYRQNTNNVKIYVYASERSERA